MVKLDIPSVDVIIDEAINNVLSRYNISNLRKLLSLIYLNMRDLLRKRCFDKFSQIECKEDLCEEDWELTNMLLTLQPIFMVNTKKKTK